MQSPQFPRYLVPPRSKYSPQHHVLKHPQLPFLPQCQRPSFTSILYTISIYRHPRLPPPQITVTNSSDISGGFFCNYFFFSESGTAVAVPASIPCPSSRPHSSPYAAVNARFQPPVFGPSVHMVISASSSLT